MLDVLAVVRGQREEARVELAVHEVPEPRGIFRAREFVVRLETGMAHVGRPRGRNLDVETAEACTGARNLGAFGRALAAELDRVVEAERRGGSAGTGKVVVVGYARD